MSWDFLSADVDGCLERFGWCLVIWSSSSSSSAGNWYDASSGLDSTKAGDIMLKCIIVVCW